ncbi:MAG: glycogen synthase GlgA [Rhodobacteraceae bacterium]|nr:glycogen synthase GlgA [Paracoccaceae bacterium]
MRAALSVASECAPLVKTGGLADVVGALPGALAPMGWGLVTLLPGYPRVMAALGGAHPVMEWAELFGGPARLWAGTGAGLRLLVLEAAHLYERPGSPYLDAEGEPWPDNDRRFAALALAAARVAHEGADGWHPEVLHLHDWQAGLAPVYLRAGGPQGPGCLFTIHNMAFHGLSPGRRRAALALPEAGFNPEGYEYHGQISPLKAGIVYADHVTTVSPTYAHEITTPEFGAGLDGVMRAREGAVSGILNGIDTDLWNPATDPDIHPFRSPRGKAANRARLMAEFALPEGPGPLCVVVSRMTGQKGLDLLLEALPALLSRGGRLAVLGTGDRALERAWRARAEAEPGLGVMVGFDEALSRRMFAGADAVLVPSRFEPCGLTQLCALRYGAIPLVSRVGGLNDTVIDANPAALLAGVATGVTFAPVTSHALAHALARLCALHADADIWARMQRRAMASPGGWERSAPDYAALYTRVARPPA